MCNQLPEKSYKQLLRKRLYLLSNGINMGTELSKSHISVLCHHAGSIEMPQTLVRVSLNEASSVLQHGRPAPIRMYLKGMLDKAALVARTAIKMLPL